MSHFSLTAHEARERMARGDLTAVELVETVLGRIEAVEDSVHAYLTLDADGAREQAARVDQARERGESAGPLSGVPIAL